MDGPDRGAETESDAGADAGSHVGADAGADATEPATAPSSLAEALEVRRNARVGLSVGLVVAALLYLPTLVALEFALLGPGGLYLGLALVLAATVAGVVTAGLCAKAFLEPVLDRWAWLRRGGTAAIVGGLAWAASPAVAWLADGGAVAAGYWHATSGLAALAMVVGTIGIHAAVRGEESSADGGSVSPANDGGDASSTTRADSWRRRVERGAYWVVVGGLLLAAGNATGNPGPIVETGTGAVPSPFLTSAFLAFAAAVPFAAAAEVAGVLPFRRLLALQFGALLSVLGVAWLVVLGGWAWLEAAVAAPAAAALVVATIPSGLGWAIAGSGLKSLATRRTERARSSQDDVRRRDN